MTGAELERIRKGLGLTLYSLAQALGYSGTRNGMHVHVRRMERGDRAIPPAIARLAQMFERYGVPADFVEPK